LIVDIELEGTLHAVDVRRDGNTWVVTIGGRRIVASVAESGGRWSMLLGESRTWRSYEVSIEGRGNGDHIVHVNGQAIPVSIVEPRAVRRRAHVGERRDAGSVVIAAPMPGRIVKVLVKPGDIVAARQGVVVVEAMKMENELRATRAGTVAEVRVSEGMSVEARSILVVIT
jgi:biotin carboxyl carrier protein